MISRYVNDGHPAPTPVLAPWRRRGAAKPKEVHHGSQSSHSSATHSVEQGQACRAEGAVQAEGRVGDTRAPGTRAPHARAGAVQSGHRQQAAGLRPGCAEGARHPAWRADRAARDHHAAQDRATGAVRDHTTYRASVQASVVEAGLKSEDYLFPSRIHGSPHICSRQYARMLRGWVRDACSIAWCSRSRSSGSGGKAVRYSLTRMDFASSCSSSTCSASAEAQEDEPDRRFLAGRAFVLVQPAQVQLHLADVRGAE
jgi:hypothetical protein